METEHYIHQKHNGLKHKKPALTKQTIYHLWPGNGADPILTPTEPTRGPISSTTIHASVDMRIYLV